MRRRIHVCHMRRRIHVLAGACVVGTWSATLGLGEYTAIHLSKYYLYIEEMRPFMNQNSTFIHQTQHTH
jgi:hypothetical protein